MKLFLCAALLALLPGAVLSQEPEKKGRTFEELGKALASEDFKIRTEATNEIWERGDDALKFLAELHNSEDPELAARAGVLRRKIRIGILPSTPAGIAEKLELYSHSTPEKKENIINELFDAQEFELLLRLRSFEKNGDVLETIESRISRIIPGMIKEHLLANETEQARKILEVGNDFASLIRYGNFLQVHGELEEALAELAESADPELQRRYLAYLRVQGDPEILKKEGERLGDREAVAAGALLMGDSLPLLKLVSENRSLPAPDLTFFKIALARKRGDLAAEERHLTDLRKMSLNGDFAERARLNLYRAGEPGLAGLSAKKSGLDAELDHLRIVDKATSIPALLGLPDRKVTDEWLAELKAGLRSDLDNGNDNGEAFTRLRQSLTHLERWGDIDSSTRIFDAFLDVLTEKDLNDFPTLIRNIRRGAPKGGMLAISQNLEKLNLTLEMIAENTFNPAIAWLLEKAKELDPELSTDEAVRLLLSYVVSLEMPRADFERWHERLRKAAFDDPKKGDDKAPGHFLTLVGYAGTASERAELLELEPLATTYRYGAARLATQRGQWEKAAQLYREIEVDLKDATPTFLAAKALALLKVGDQEGEKLLKLASLIGDGDVKYLIGLALFHEEYLDLEKRDAILKMAVLRSKDALFGSLAYRRSSLLAHLGEAALERGDWREAAPFFEAALISDEFDSTALASCFKSEFAKGLAAVDAGERERGVALLKRAHGLLPASGLLADHFFPMIRERGLTALHDRLCQATLALMHEQIEAFPNYDTVKNGYAWVASRANRNLLEAEKQVREALEKDPYSEAYLDTLAEVKFAMGEREAAISWSEKAADRSISTVVIRTQLERFRSAPLPAP